MAKLELDIDRPSMRLQLRQLERRLGAREHADQLGVGASSALQHREQRLARLAPGDHLLLDEATASPCSKRP